ncbi:type II toxin-antitoxin system HicB family antitoxin [Candidatus Sumerlaeota bacterium]|nr:type II toxin-antitoxin system HicB family antitoxin [Candidatus Sumerlaeota bacterium]
MQSKRFIYYEEEGMWIGWLEEFPEYHTQGESLDELKENLKDIYEELTSGSIPRHVEIGESLARHILKMLSS